MSEVVAVVRDIVALGSQDAVSALTALHERGREARESVPGQGTVADAFVGCAATGGEGRCAREDGRVGGCRWGRRWSVTSMVRAWTHHRSMGDGRFSLFFVHLGMVIRA